MERSINFLPAFDKRNTTPGKDYGIHCAEIFFTLKGKEGAITFLVFTGWYLPHNAESMPDSSLKLMLSPSGAGITYHSPKPLYKGQSFRNDCNYCSPKCYSDFSILESDKYLKILISKGLSALWIELETYYTEIFEPKKKKGSKAPL